MQSDAAPHAHCEQHPVNSDALVVTKGKNTQTKNLHKLGTRWPFTGVTRALRARNPEKVWKKSPGAGPPKVWKKSGKSLESLEKVSKRSRKDFFETFSRLSGAPGPETFSRLFRGFGPGGPE